MPRGTDDYLGRRLAKLEAEIKKLQKGRLQNSSLHGSALPVYDDDDVLKAIMGRQPDGSYGVLPRNSGPQPRPSAPILPSGTEEEPVRSSFPVEWDGHADAPVPEVHGHVELWGQRLVGDDVADVSKAKLMGTIRDREGGATTVAAGAPGVWVFWFRMAGSDRVTKGEFSGPSTVTVTALVDSQDIEDRLNAFADGDLGDGAYESLLARLGEFMNIKADQIDVNSLAADQAFISLLEAAGIVLRDEAGGRQVELSGSGLLMTETDTGDPLMQLGLYGDDFFSLTNEEGEQSVVLQRTGLVAGEVVSSETDLLVGGRELVGTAMDHPGGRESSAVLDPFPRAILAQLERPFTEDSSTGQEITIGYLQARLQRGRVYRIKCNPFVMGAGTSGADMLVYQTTGEDDWPVMPSSSTGWSRGPQRGMPTTSGTPVLQYEALYRPETDQYFRCIFVIRRTEGSSVYFLPWSRGTAHMMIEDIGADANHTGRPLFRLASNNGDVGTSESVSVTRTPEQGQTYQATSVDASSFTAASPDPESRYRHGYWDAAFVTQPTHYMAGFRFTDSTSQINGREVISAEWRVLVDAWALKTIGDSIYPGIRVGGGTLPSSMSPSSVEWLDNVEGRLPGRWASIPVPDEHLQEVIDGSAQLVLGRPSMSRRAGAATPANGVQLVFRVTQT